MQSLGLGRIGKVALDLLYPPRCAVCGSGGAFLCDACLGAMPSADGPRCDLCWRPMRSQGCVACAEHPGDLARLRSAFRYEGEARKVVRAFKFSGRSSLAHDLGRVLAATYEKYDLDADLIVPVPLTGSRERTRGYNQSRLLATELSKVVDVPVRDGLRRRGNVDSQAESVSADQRRANVVGVFVPAKAVALSGARILLVDDVATTGATLNACARVLLDAGAASVSGLTIARED